MAASDRDVLPATLKPLHYKVDIHDLELGGDFSFAGTVRIDIGLKSPTKSVIINAHKLELKTAQISGQKASSISYDEKRQRATLEFPENISESKDVVLQIEYTGVMNSDMAGFYRSKYKPKNTPAKSVPKEGEHHLMFSTQFESCDARRAFPCFDEPNLKASFDVSIELPDDQTALSNMPEKESKPSSKSGLKIVSFQRTPRMSTYLLAWVVADLKYVETTTNRSYKGRKLPVRVYTTPGHEKQGQFGADVCAKVVDFYSDIFQLEYPLPKIDLVAVHEFSHGAMENWGLITYRTTAILYDPDTSDACYKNRVSYVVAHELAHQWFGNLVTMDWWNELWLNEGFATWVGWYAIDNFFPEFGVWSQFVTEAVQTAQNLDGLRSSHAVEVPVKDALEVEQIFDAISYLKGSSIIRMLTAHLGIEDFLRGIAAYLKRHAYGNATTNDLWVALSEASGKDVKLFMDAWITKIGFPVVTIAEEPGQIAIEQSRFLSAGDVKPEEDTTLWWIPLGLKTANNVTPATQELATKAETIRSVDESFYKINSYQNGFYRTNYPPERLAKLGAEKAKIEVEGRIALVADAEAMAVAGLGRTAGLLTLVENFQDESSKAVFAQIAASLAAVRSAFAESEAVTRGLKAFTLRLFSPVAEKLGWEQPQGEDYLTGQLRSLVIRVVGGAGHQKIIHEAQRQFGAYVSGDKAAIHPSLRIPVFRIAIENGGASEYKALKKEYAQTTSIDGKEVCLTAMGQVPTAELARDFLDFQFSDEVATQDVHTGSISLAANSRGRKVLWDYFRSEWKTVSKKLAARPIIMDRYIKSTLSKYSSHEMEQSISEFFKDKNTEGYERGLRQVLDKVRTNARYRERDENLVLEWLLAHEYA